MQSAIDEADKKLVQCLQDRQIIQRDTDGSLGVK